MPRPRHAFRRSSASAWSSSLTRPGCVWRCTGHRRRRHPPGASPAHGSSPVAGRTRGAPRGAVAGDEWTRWTPPRAEHGGEWRPRWCGPLGGGVRSIPASGAVVRCIGRTGAHPPTMPCTPTHRTTAPVRRIHRIARSTGARRSGRHSRPLHPMRVQRATVHRMRCTRCTPLTGCAAGFHPAHPVERNPCPATSSAESSTFPLDTLRYHHGDTPHRALDARCARGDLSLPTHRAPSPCVGAMRGAEHAVHRCIAVRSTEWKRATSSAPSGEWRPPDAGGVHSVRSTGWGGALHRPQLSSCL